MIDTTYIYVFLLTLARITAFLVTAPVFSSKGVPAHFKVGLGFFISLIILPTVSIDIGNFSFDGSYLFYIIKEVLLGLAIGFVAQLIFSSIQIAGSFVDMQIGFALANVIDPQTGAQSPLMGNFKYMFAVLLFLTLDGHHLFLDSIISSYQSLPLTGDWLNQINKEPMLLFILSTIYKMFLIAFKIASPIVVTLFMTDVALGIVARTVPQLNVFVVGLPLKVLVNFFLMLLIAASFIYMFKELFQEMFISINQFIDLMR